MGKDCPTDDVSHTSSDAEASAAQAWGALAALIAGSGHMRFATRAGKYPRPRNAPQITGTLPRRPAAVMIHGADGSVSTLCLDLDTSKAAQSVVDADAAAICALLTSCGLRYVTDHSPSGGRHIYVPLATRLAHESARELVEALGARFASIDPGPHRNISEGCIRPPGSPHKSGHGYQVLDTPLSQAYDVMRRRNADAALSALRTALAASIHQLRSRRTATGTPQRLQAVAAAGAGATTFAKAARAVALKGSPLRQLAATGIYDAAKYRSPSQARMAVLTHLANFPITLDEIRQRFATDLAGLAALYTDQRHMDRLLAFEWNKALALVGKNPATKRAGDGTSLKSDTEPALTHGGADQSPRSSASVMHEINDLENVLYAVLDQRLAKSGREGITLRLLLRAVIGFARKKETLVIDVGCRAFALDMGRHHGTIAKLLPRLEKLTEGLIERIERGRGKGADVYLLSLPAQWRETADALSWRKGKIYGIRPVFRVLGDVAALVYENIERARLAPTAAEIVRSTGIGRTAVDQALKTLAELSMIERRHGTWHIIHTTNLSQIADWLGAQDEYEYQLRLVRAQRRDWHARLERHREPAIHEEDLYDREKEEWDPWDPNFGKASDPPDGQAAAAA
ncbi:hypothetical protein [Arthrobacter sp. ES1]|uniref:hypothetical protein n=1 Tax=Arthrobacter sp. ES1 TaxID=1897056 RepID=UPI001CFFD8D2|nr:hypothetical protein [Arthrobacter sp. ES1]MCB5280477.1 hypothetical protein [Arthrobacter sp. ES1]